MPTEPRAHTFAEFVDELTGLLVGIGLIVMVAFPFALPLILLTALVAVPLLLIGLVAGLLAIPVLLLRRVLVRRDVEGADRDASARGVVDAPAPRRAIRLSRV